MLSEEQELIRLEAEQAALEDQVTTAELTLETSKTETAQFQHRYHQTVGRLYAQLDELDALIARVQAGLSPDDAAAQAHAQATEQQAKASAEEAGLIEAQPAPPPVITAELKLAFRQAAKLMQCSRLRFFTSRKPSKKQKQWVAILWVICHNNLCSNCLNEKFNLRLRGRCGLYL